jgi:phosphotriesterase-related protein
MTTRGFVQTVLGPVRPEELGLTIVHEHLLIDMTGTAGSCEERAADHDTVTAGMNRPDAGWEEGEAGPGTTASFLPKWREEVTLENRIDMARNWPFYGSFRQNSVETAVFETERFKMAGGGCVVDQTALGMARDPLGLRKVSRATGTHIVMGGGYYLHGDHPSDMDELTEDELYRRMIRDAVDGTGDSGQAGGVKMGIIGEVGLSWPTHPNEAKALAAAVRVQQDAGLALSIHPGWGEGAAVDALQRVVQMGGDPQRTIISHCDHRVPYKPAPDSFDIEQFFELADTGCYLSFDGFGKEESFRQNSVVDMPNDANRINYLLALAERGHGHQLLVSHDISLLHWRNRFGGQGIEHIPVAVVPLMRRKGATQDLIDQILVENPAEILTIV